MTLEEAIEARHSVRAYKAFLGTMAKYGKFRNVGNYIVMAGQKADDLDERVG